MHGSVFKDIPSTTLYSIIFNYVFNELYIFEDAISALPAELLA